MQLRAALSTPTDPASLAVFRVLFGVVVAASAARFLASGYLPKLYADDAFYFRYPGFAWVPAPGPDAIFALYVAFIVLGVLMAIGLCTRLALASFVVLFAWVQLIDVTNYLNHYWLVWLLAVLLVVSPSHAIWSLDRRLPWRLTTTTVPFVFIAVLRVQVACVYVFAAVAKLGGDWLLYGQPLGMWLPARDELWLIGPLLRHPWVPLIASWCGFVYDASVVFFLSWARTRRLAYVAVLAFHGMTFALFEIGMFPFIMTTATTIFFDPSWPRRFFRASPSSSPSPSSPLSSSSSSSLLPHAAVFVFVTWCLIHVALPLRHHVLSDDVLWDEAGMRFSWRVMVREKSASLEFRVTRPGGRVVIVSPHGVLSHRQVNEMVGQPDLILQLAHHIRDDFAAKGEVVEVRADALVSLNGRPTQRFIDPSIDLAVVDDTIRRPTWVLPAPTSPPPSRFRR